MKNCFLFLLLLPLLVLAQAPVKTENASNRFKFYNAATTGDTVFTSASSVASGSSIANYNTRGYLVGVLIGTPVSKDVITLKGGAGTIAVITLDTVYTAASTGSSTRYTTPIWVPLNVKLDTMLIYIQTKASNSTLFFRTGY